MLFRSHLIWNYATDLSINTMLDVQDLPEGGLIPGHHLPKLTDEDKQKMGAEQVERYQSISDLIASFPPNKSADWYFEQLMNNETIQDMLEKGEAAMKELQDLFQNSLSKRFQGKLKKAVCFDPESEFPITIIF